MKLLCRIEQRATGKRGLLFSFSFLSLSLSLSISVLSHDADFCIAPHALESGPDDETTSKVVHQNLVCKASAREALCHQQPKSCSGEEPNALWAFLKECLSGPAIQTIHTHTMGSTAHIRTHTQTRTHLPDPQAGGWAEDHPGSMLFPLSSLILVLSETALFVKCSRVLNQSFNDRRAAISLHGGDLLGGERLCITTRTHSLSLSRSLSYQRYKLTSIDRRMHTWIRHRT